METLETRLDLKRNGLNLIRLCLAVFVIVSHSWTLGGFGPEPSLFGMTLGGLAVAGFFTISGYLIAQSRLQTSAVQFILRRVFRIFPAYWVALAFVAFITSPIVAALMNNPWRLEDAVAYVFRGVPLVTGQSASLNSVLEGLPYPAGSNGSLWTLAPEFLFYLALAAAFAIRPIRKSRWFVGAGYIAVTIFAWSIQTSHGLPRPVFEILSPWSSLLTYFVSGIALYWYRGRVVSSRWLAILSLVVFFAICSAGWGPWLGGLPLAYFIMWSGSVLPRVVARLGATNDLSYGMYVYAFPMQQVLAAFGVHEAGIVEFVFASVLVSTPLAVASWFWIERPAQRLSRRLTRTPAQ